MKKDKSIDKDNEEKVEWEDKRFRDRSSSFYETDKSGERRLARVNKPTRIKLKELLNDEEFL